MENNLLRRINELHRAQLEPLVKFLPLILDKLLLLMVKPPAFDGHILNVGPAAFNAIAMIVNKLTSSVSPFTLFLVPWVRSQQGFFINSKTQRNFLSARARASSMYRSFQKVVSQLFAIRIHIMYYIFEFIGTNVLIT